MTVVPVDLIGKKDNSVAYFSSVSLDQYEVIRQRASAFLHPNELAYFSSLQHQRRQKSYLTGRYASKEALSRYLKGSNPGEIEILSGIFGQPIVRCLSEKIPGISLSHNDRFAVAIAFSEAFPIAIDIESAKECRIKIMQSILTNREVAFTKSAILAEQILCTLLWTAKEALSKAIRCGLMVPFKVLEVETDCLKAESGYFEESILTLTFTNFPFLKAYSWIIDDQVVSIVLPENLEIELAIERLKPLFCESATTVV